MSNEYTKQKLKEWIENEIQRAKNPDPRELVIEERAKKKKTTKKRYGLS